RARSERASPSSAPSTPPARLRGRPSVPVRERDWPEVRRQIEEKRRAREAKLLVFEDGAAVGYIRAAELETVIPPAPGYSSPALLRDRDGRYFLRRSGAFEVRALSEEGAAVRLWEYEPSSFPDELLDALLRAKSRVRGAPRSATTTKTASRNE